MDVGYIYIVITIYKREKLVKSVLGLMPITYYKNILELCLWCLLIQINNTIEIKEYVAIKNRMVCLPLSSVIKLHSFISLPLIVIHHVPFKYQPSILYQTNPLESLRDEIHFLAALSQITYYNCKANLGLIRTMYILNKYIKHQFTE